MKYISLTLFIVGVLLVIAPIFSTSNFNIITGYVISSGDSYSSKGQKLGFFLLFLSVLTELCRLIGKCILFCGNFFKTKRIKIVDKNGK
jgi:hypothetical protein